jgi:hypothetical protein
MTVFGLLLIAGIIVIGLVVWGIVALNKRE